MKDLRIWLGAAFIVGYYATLWLIGLIHIDPTNVPLIKDALLQLGPPIGVIVGSLFRSDRADEARAENTGKAFDAMTAQANSSAPPPVTVAPDATSVTIGADPPAETLK